MSVGIYVQVATSWFVRNTYTENDSMLYLKYYFVYYVR